MVPRRLRSTHGGRGARRGRRSPTSTSRCSTAPAPPSATSSTTSTRSPTGSCPSCADRPLSVIRVHRGQEPFMQKNVPEVHARLGAHRARSGREASQARRRATRCATTAARCCGSRTSARSSTTRRSCRADRRARPTAPRARPRPARGRRLRGGGRAPRTWSGRRWPTSGWRARSRPAARRACTCSCRSTARRRREDAAAATRAHRRPRRARSTPTLATTAFIKEDRGGKVFVDSDPGRRRDGGRRLQPAGPARACRCRSRSPGTSSTGVTPADFTVHTALGAARRRATRGRELMPAPQALPAELVEEGHAIPVAAGRRPCTRASGGPAPAGPTAPERLRPPGWHAGETRKREGPVDDDSGLSDRPRSAIPGRVHAPIEPLGTTAEELLELPDDGMRHELVEGELKLMTTARGSPPPLRGASPSWLPTSWSRSSLRGTAREVSAKAAMWLDAGARLVWVVDPQGRLATVHHPGGQDTVLREDGALEGEDVLPGFRLPWRRSCADQSMSGGRDGSSWCSKARSSRRADVRPGESSGIPSRANHSTPSVSGLVVAVPLRAGSRRPP